MKLKDIRPGEPLVLEVIWGENTYEIPTNAIGANESGLLIKPVLYGEDVIDFGAGNGRDMIFSIHIINPEDGSRNVWRNVQLKTINYNGTTYYATKTSNFNSISKSSERRGNNRMVLDIDGSIELISDDKKVLENIHIIDISDNGISFTSSPMLDLDMLPHVVRFKDTVNGIPFELSLKCVWVRKMTEPKKIFWGCKVTEADRNVLAYICRRRALLK